MLSAGVGAVKWRLSQEELSRIIDEALARLPEEFREAIDNVAIMVEDRPPRDVLEDLGIRKGNVLLGRFVGIPKGSRGRGYSGVLPDRITLYLKPIESLAGSRQEVVDLIRETLLHELGHHFGLSDWELERLGF